MTLNAERSVAERPRQPRSNERRKTEVGEIPTDWKAVLLDSVARRGSGHTPDKKHPEYWNGSIRWVSLADSAQLDNGLIRHTSATITPEGIANSSAVLHSPGTVILSRDAGVGKSAILADEMAVSQHFMAWSCGRSIDNYFLYYWLQANKAEFERIAIGNTIKTIGLPYFKRMKVPLPPFPEQRAIAAALSDVDELIGALDKLIDKKRAIKLATMQQLLTGKTRLPGFSGEWANRVLGDFACIRNVKVMPRQVAPNTPCVELEHIGQRDGRLLGCSTARSSTSSKYRFERGDVLFGRLRPYLRKYWHADRDGICTTEIWPLMVDTSQASSGFLRGIVETESFIDAASVSYGTHMPRADWGVVRNFEVSLPPLKEQEAIAVVLSDMDAEIAALQQRREKSKAIKQGMMQSLLSGRVRLDELEVAA